jgi:leucyl-tRNA---protein transferase
VIEDFTTIDTLHKELHRTYRAFIDFDGAWSIEECLFGEDVSLHNIFNTKCISIYDRSKLVAAGYFDLGTKTAASILHFYDPLYSRYSLGKFLILITIDYLKDHHIDFYYPGYLVQGVSKMNYKLFLGEGEAQYFDPLTASWKHFDQRIL